MLSLWGRVTRTSHLLESTVTGTKRAFHELGYFHPRYAKYGDDDFAEEDMFKSIGSFQRDRGLKEDEEMRENGPTQHHVNAELVKKRRRELDPDGRLGLRDSPGLGLRSSVGRDAENKAEDVKKTKKALAALKMYSRNKKRINDGKADDEMQDALDIMKKKHAIGIQKGRIDSKAAADKLHELANGNNVRYLAAELQKLGLGGNRIAEILNLPSKNYVPEKVRGRDINGNKRTDIDEKEANKEEYDAEKARKILIAEKNAESQTQEGDGEKTVTESQKQEADRKKPVTEKDEDSKTSNPLSRLIPTAHAAEPETKPQPQEEEMQKDKTTTEKQNQPEVQEAVGETEAKENDLGYTNTMHAKSGDPKKRQFDYRNMSNDYLREKHPDFKIPGRVDGDKDDEENGGINVDEPFIFDRESGPGKIGLAQHGYVPGVDKKWEGKPIGKSGVTIGFGVDLGQMNHADLSRYVKKGTPMYDKLSPYLGKTGDEAVRYLKDNPLELTEGEALALTRSVHSYFNNRIKERYDEEKGKGAYDELNPAYKTAMLSYHLQMGQNKKGDVWDAALTGNPDVFEAALRKAGGGRDRKDVKDGKFNRRELEANYIEDNQ